MVETLKRPNVYRSYIRSVLRMYAYKDADRFDSDEADALREQMVEPWYALTEDERKRMDGLVMDLNDLRASRAKNWRKDRSEKKKQEGLVRIREVFDLKSAGKFDEALEHLRKWKDVIAPEHVWHFRGSCWNYMNVPEVAVEFYREACRLSPFDEKIKGVYLNVLKVTNLKQAKEIADQVLASPIKHDLTLVVYAAEVEATFINTSGDAEASERTRALVDVLEPAMQRLIVSEEGPQLRAVIGMAGTTLSSCYVALGNVEQAHALLSFLIGAIEPTNALLYAARGKLGFPTKDAAVGDLKKSIELGLPMSWPLVWIAAYYVEKGDYDACRKTCMTGFQRPLVPKIRSELLELFAIAEASSGAPLEEVREIFKDSIRADVTNASAVENLERLEKLAQDPTRKVRWRRSSPIYSSNPEREEEQSYYETLQKELAIAA